MPKEPRQPNLEIEVLMECLEQFPIYTGWYDEQLEAGGTRMGVRKAVREVVGAMIDVSTAATDQWFVLREELYNLIGRDDRHIDHERFAALVVQRLQAHQL